MDNELSPQILIRSDSEPFLVHGSSKVAVSVEPTTFGGGNPATPAKPHWLGLSQNRIGPGDSRFFMSSCFFLWFSGMRHGMAPVAHPTRGFLSSGKPKSGSVETTSLNSDSVPDFSASLGLGAKVQRDTGLILTQTLAGLGSLDFVLIA